MQFTPTIDKVKLKEALIEILENPGEDLLDQLRNDEGDGVSLGKFASTYDVRYALDLLHDAAIDGLSLDT